MNGKFSTSTSAWKPENLILLREKHAQLSVSAVMFFKQFLLGTLMGLLSYTIHIASYNQVCLSIRISVVTACTVMFCTIEPSFFKTISGMHRRPFEG